MNLGRSDGMCTISGDDTKKKRTLSMELGDLPDDSTMGIPMMPSSQNIMNEESCLH
jgi:hypothetical protein